jgi:hypothetical protein
MSISKTYDVSKMSVRQLKDASDDARLILSPPCQRREVWSDGKKNALIDSILRGFPCSAFILQTTGDKDNVIDGKQRIITIVDFINNKFKYRKPSAGNKNGSKLFDISSTNVEDFNPLYGKTFQQFPKEIQSRIQKYEIPVVTIDDDVPNNTVNAMFYRLNTGGVKLNATEIQKAAYAGVFMTSLNRFAESAVKNIPFSPTKGKRMYDLKLVQSIFGLREFGINGLNITDLFHAEAFLKAHYDEGKLNNTLSSMLRDRIEFIDKYHPSWDNFKRQDRQYVDLSIITIVLASLFEIDIVVLNKYPQKYLSIMDKTVNANTGFWPQVMDQSVIESKKPYLGAYEELKKNMKGASLYVTK